MVWGGISHGLKSPLIVIAGNLTGVRYRDEILRPVAVPFVQQHHLIFQQDNARPHIARVCQDFLANHNINPLDWPPYSPDLSPIEHLWDEMDRRVRGRRNAPATLDQLRAALLEEWDNIPMRRINALMNSMHRRIRAVTDARGGIRDIDDLIDFTLTYWGYC
jgi:transposase